MAFCVILQIMNTRLSTFLTSIIIALSLALPSCDPSEDNDSLPVPGRRTVLVYQVANNNLGSSGFDIDDINEMKRGASQGAIPADCRLLVYSSRPSGTPCLFEIKKDRSDTLMTYSTDVLSVDSRRMLQALSDMERFAPAGDYGLVLWSHGSGWLQDGIADSNDGELVKPLSFGSEGSARHTMNITTLANTLAKGPKLGFIYFDCCYMASVETLYQLRYAAPYIVGSATELLTAGMPYDRNLACFFAPGEADLTGAARNTFDLYNGQNGMSRTCTMSVVRTDALEALADATARIYEAADGSLPAGFVPQRFMSYGVVPCYYYDFAHYVKALCFDGETERFENAGELHKAFAEAMDKCVLYSAATPYLWNSVPLDHHCGMSTHIMNRESDSTLKKYSTLAWYQDVASSLYK